VLCINALLTVCHALLCAGMGVPWTYKPLNFPLARRSTWLLEMVLHRSRLHATTPTLQVMQVPHRGRSTPGRCNAMHHERLFTTYTKVRKVQWLAGAIISDAVALERTAIFQPSSDAPPHANMLTPCPLLCHAPVDLSQKAFNS